VCPIIADCRWAQSGFAPPDPVLGSAGISGPQSTFVGSDRQGRGRLVDALRLGPVALGDLPTVMGWPDDPLRAGRVAETLVADGLAVSDGDRLRLP
jgi:A/G-specific adenine glycosylase